MTTPVTAIKELRDQTGAGVMECKNALMETDGDIEKATDILQARNLMKAQKKIERTANQGTIAAYIHTGGRVGAIIELNCETDFVARTDEFKQLAHNLAMQITAQDPKYISKEDVPQDAELETEPDCLLLQPFIKSPDKTVYDIICETIAKVGENIRINRFTRFGLEQ